MKDPGKIVEVLAIIIVGILLIFGLSLLILKGAGGALGGVGPEG